MVRGATPVSHSFQVTLASLVIVNSTHYLFSFFFSFRIFPLLRARARWCIFTFFFKMEIKRVDLGSDATLSALLWTRVTFIPRSSYKARARARVSFAIAFSVRLSTSVSLHCFLPLKRFFVFWCVGR